MERDLANEIDELKEEIHKIHRILGRAHLPFGNSGETGPGSKILTAEGVQQLNELRDELVAYTDTHATTGALTYAGTFCTGDEESTRQSMWSMVVSTDDLLALNENHTVEKILTSIGNSRRLAILLALLKKPLTAQQLLEITGANTTGQIYHHLKSLLSADIVTEEKGIFVVVPQRVQGIILLLAGVMDLVDTRYNPVNKGAEL